MAEFTKKIEEAADGAEGRFSWVMYTLGFLYLYNIFKNSKFLGGRK